MDAVFTLCIIQVQRHKESYFFIGCFFPLARALLVDAAKGSDICRLLEKLDKIIEVDQTWKKHE